MMEGRKMTKVMATVLTLCVLLVVTFVGVLRLYPQGDSTMWSPGFSEIAFMKVRVGDTKDSVLRAVGEPLNIYRTRQLGTRLKARGRESAVTLSEDNYWSYTAPGRSSSCAYYVRELVFDTSGRVLKKEAYFEPD